jgi:hypothetical protein
MGLNVYFFLSLIQGLIMPLCRILPSALGQAVLITCQAFGNEHLGMKLKRFVMHFATIHSYAVIVYVCLLAWKVWVAMFLRFDYFDFMVNTEIPTFFFLHTSRVLACLLAFSLVLSIQKLAFAMFASGFHHTAYAKRIHCFNEFSAIIASLLEQIDVSGGGGKVKKRGALRRIIRSELDRRTCPQRYGDPVKVTKILFDGLKRSESSLFVYESDLYRFVESKQEANDIFLRFDLLLNESISIEVSLSHLIPFRIWKPSSLVFLKPRRC